MKLHDDQKTVVMVVDDAVDSIRMINDALEEAGMMVLVALEGNQALTISRNITPDLVLMDALMPHMDGFETCRRLKENAAFADIPIIFMTGLSDTEHVVMGLSAGGVDYVNKHGVARTHGGAPDQCPDDQECPLCPGHRRPEPVCLRP